MVDPGRTRHIPEARPGPLFLLRSFRERRFGAQGFEGVSARKDVRRVVGRHRVRIPPCPRAERLRSIRPARKSRRRRRFRFGRIFRLTLDQESHHLGCILADIEANHIFVELLCARRRDGDRIQAVRHQDAVHHEASRALVPVEIDLSATHKELVGIEKDIRESTAKHNRFLEELGLSPLPSPDRPEPGGS